MCLIFGLFRTPRWTTSYREGTQPASGRDSFTRSASAETLSPITTFDDLSFQFKRAASASASAEVTSISARQVDVDVFTAADFNRRMDNTKSSPYTRVSCKFNDGVVSEVSMTFCSPLP